MKEARKTILELHEELAIGIIVQAAEDYRKVLKQLEEKPLDSKLLSEKTEIEQFFCSQWYDCLTTVDGRMILQRLQNGE